MDYEKNYNKALERAKQAIKDCGYNQGRKEMIYSIFPELKESEDERIRKFLVKHVSEWIGCIEHDLKLSSKDVESEEELAMFKAGLAYLERQKEQKPAEWSEEDKRKFNRIYEILGYAADDKEFLTSKRIIGDKEAIELQDFLKSLRSRPKPSDSWKPSEEQMRIFNEAVEHYSKYWDSEDIKILCSLYGDLKKLL